MAASFVVVLVLGGASVGCRARPATEEPELQTVEVEDPTAGIVPDFDAKEKRQGRPDLVGLLPGDFPVDLPVFTPANIVDFGQEGERAYTEINTDSPPGEVIAWYRRRLRSPLRETAAGVWADSSREIRITQRGGRSYVRYSYPKP